MRQFRVELRARIDKRGTGKPPACGSDENLDVVFQVTLFYTAIIQGHGSVDDRVTEHAPTQEKQDGQG